MGVLSTVVETGIAIGFATAVFAVFTAFSQYARTTAYPLKLTFAEIVAGLRSRSSYTPMTPPSPRVTSL